MRDTWQCYANVVAVGAGSDTAPLAKPAMALYLTTAGIVKVTTVGGQTVTLPSLPVGIVPIQVTQVFATPIPPAGVLALY
jgi:hypothetical protein